jgi:hypothetical protein
MIKGERAKFFAFSDSEYSLWCSQGQATVTYPGSHEFFSHYLPIYVKASRHFNSPQTSSVKLWMYFLNLPMRAAYFPVLIFAHFIILIIFGESIWLLTSLHIFLITIPHVNTRTLLRITNRCPFLRARIQVQGPRETTRDRIPWLRRPLQLQTSISNRWGWKPDTV